jgi:hypothetical protein
MKYIAKVKIKYYQIVYFLQYIIIPIWDKYIFKLAHLQIFKLLCGYESSHLRFGASSQRWTGSIQ